MKKKVQISKNLEQKEILKKSIQNSEKNADLYKSIFGGRGIDSSIGTCGVVAISGASAAYDRAHDTFLRA
ncbi:hypothetical protein C1631_014615 [Chryseobacterium phosphatilyticum]|uniref:Uncharacterized protein n=1 Tax=Chryseobacterium phosphatilyticum TaxID=475075 RepID=A0A316X637_9FLAO|nr:hypothetical protein [Chryseobacterium phosphatilyticum]PWN69285.1 hypothetical protein C1631_014615 [Chryseobacterium phosphatilyticum]